MAQGCKLSYRVELLTFCLFILQKLFLQRLVVSFLGVFLLLTYIKYYTGDYDTAVYHLGFVASGFTIAVYGSPLISLVRIILNFNFSVKFKDRGLVAKEHQSLFWPKYGKKNACSFLTHEYAKHNEWVIGDDGKFTRLLACSLA